MSEKRVTRTAIEAWRLRLVEFLGARGSDGSRAGSSMEVEENIIDGFLTIMRTLLSERDEAMEDKESIGRTAIRFLKELEETRGLQRETEEVLVETNTAMKEARLVADKELGRASNLLAERDALKAEVARLSGKTQFCHECERRQREIDRLTKQYTRFADLMAAPLLVADPPPPPISQAAFDDLRQQVGVLRNEWRNLIVGRLRESAHKDVLRRLDALEQAVKKI